MIRKEALGMVYKSFETGIGESGNRISKRFSSKKNSLRKGFTLVELIVVLVVMAILAAIMVPAFLGFIDNAKDKEYIAVAESARKSTQSTLNGIFNDSDNDLDHDKRVNAARLADIDPDGGTEFTIWTQKTLETGKTQSTVDNLGAYTVSYALYKTSGDTDAKYVVYNGKNWEICDTETDALGMISERIDNNIIYMWPDYKNGKNDLAHNDNVQPHEDWQNKGSEGTPIEVVLHAPEHGVIFAKQNSEGGESVSSTREIVLKFTKRNNVYTTGSFPLFEQNKFSTIETADGKYDVKVEGGFAPIDPEIIKWKASESSESSLTLSGIYSSPELLAEARREGDENIYDLYAYPTKLYDTKNVTFLRSLDYFSAAAGESPSISFNKYSNQYDKTYADNEDITSYVPEGRSGYSAGLSELINSESYEFLGWACKASSSADYEKVDGKVYPYNGEEDLWNRVFNAGAYSDTSEYAEIKENGSFTGLVQKTKNVKFTIAEDDQENANFTPSGSELTLHIYNILPLEDEVWDDFDDYEDKKIQVNPGWRFDGWKLNGTGELIESLNEIKSYVSAQSGTEYTYVAQISKIGKALLLKSSDNATDIGTLRGQISAMAGGDKSKLLSFSRVSDWAAFENAVKDDTTIIMDENRFGNAGSNNAAVYPASTAGIEKVFVLYDGKKEGYDAPVFAYTKAEGGGYKAYWYSEGQSIDFESGSYEGVFEGCTNISFGENDLNQWNTGACTSFKNFFNGCKNAGTINVPDWTTSNATSMEGMFEGCTSLTTINMDYTKFTAGTSLTNVSNMFKNCKCLKGLDLRGFGTCNIDNISGWFYHCDHLKYIDLSLFVPTQLTNIEGAFYSVGNYDGDVSGKGTAYDLQPEDGCAVFASGTWNCTEGLKDSTGYDYFRIILYGKLYKNTDPNNGNSKNMSFKIVGTNPVKYETLTITKKGAEHLAVSSPDRLYTSENKYGNPTITSYTNVPNNNIRACTGYFNMADSVYYRSNEWKTE